MKKSNSKITFYVSIFFVLAIVLFGVFLPKSFEIAGNSAFDFLGGYFGWLYVMGMLSFVIFVIWIGFFSKYKNTRLGADDSKPEYSNLSWFGMLFSAGMGIGLVFWGVAEPLNFFVAPPGLEPGSVEAAQFAFKKAFLHWGLHPWAGYSVLALALAISQYRKNRGSLVSSLFVPLIGDQRANGTIGNIIDVLAIFATAGGIATSLGLGATQIISGLNYLFDVPNTTITITILVVIISFIYIITALAGVDKGIKLVCDLNVRLMFLVMGIAIIVGPTITIISNLFENIGLYIQTMPTNFTEMGALQNRDWYSGWTVFYWAWWIAWAPFSAIFIAKISKGRTIKEFVKGVLFLPAGASFIWFSIFGTMGIDLGLETAIEAVKDTSTALFVVLAEYPLGTILSVIIIFLLCTFFITSANSATFVLGMLSSDGNPEPPKSKLLLWGILQAALALTLLVATDNGLQMLQMISIVSAFPFIFIMFGAMAALVKELKSDG